MAKEKRHPFNIRKCYRSEVRNISYGGNETSNCKAKYLEKFYRVISYKTSLRESLALEIGLKILASGSSSILYENLVNKKKVFSAVGGYYQGLTRGEGSVYFYAIPDQEIEFEKIDKIINDEIDTILKKEFQKKDLKLKRKNLFLILSMKETVF